MAKFLNYLVWGGMLVKIGLSFMAPLDVSVLQAKLFYPDSNDPFVVSRGLVRAWGKVTGTGTYQASGMGLIIFLALVYLVYKSVNLKLPESPTWLVVLAAIFNPWLNYLAVFHWQESLSLIFGLIFWVDKNVLRRVMWVTLLCLSSASGLVLGIGVLLLWMISEPKLLKLVSVLVVLAWFGTQASLLQPYFESSPVKELTPKYLGGRVDEIQKNIFLGSQKKIIYPAVIRKIVFNKVILGVNILLGNAIGVVDFTQLAAPVSAMSITRLSGLPPKGIFSQIYYWELPLLLYGAWIAWKERGDKMGWVAFLAVIPALFWEKKWFYLSAYGLVPVFVWFVARAIVRWPMKLRLVIGGLYCLSGFYFWKQFHFDPASYRSSDVYLYKQINLWIRKEQDSHEKIMVTDMFGPTDFMNQFYGGIEAAKIVYGEFDLRKNEPVSGMAYIGLPGQFKPEFSDKKITVITAEDELVYRYGKGLWVLE